MVSQTQLVFLIVLFMTKSSTAWEITDTAPVSTESVPSQLPDNTSDLNVEMKLKSFEDALRSFPRQLFLLQVNRRLIQYIQPSILVIGCMGNTVALIVMLQEHNRRLSSCVYLAVLALSDNGFIFSFGVLWLKLIGWIDSQESADTECRVLSYIILVSN